LQIIFSLEEYPLSSGGLCPDLTSSPIRFAGRYSTGLLIADIDLATALLVIITD
jgi:hypothetical protein